MSNKKVLLVLILISIPGSFVSFYATNLILSDVANMFLMTMTKDLISSLPIFFIAVEFVVVSIGILRVGINPEEKQRLLRGNASVIAVLSLAGMICAVLSGLIVYGSFTAPYPFPAATILTTAFHTAVFTAALIVSIRISAGRKEEKTDPAACNKRTCERIRRLLMAIFTYYAFDRLGAVLWMPVYVRMSTISMTFPFYMSLLLPAFLLLHHCRYKLGFYRNMKTSGLVSTMICLTADILLCVAVVTLGINNTQFISAISPALGIERMLSMPVVTIAHFSLLTFLIVRSLIAVVRNRDLSGTASKQTDSQTYPVSSST